ncbi:MULTISPECIES: ATP-binding protein [unclassified Isoptericola]|uniref:ATP-binding protein n=1 Tax=unclassified Isoptericola TaxID=2623355 RepID=UPI00364D27A2
MRGERDDAWPGMRDDLTRFVGRAAEITDTVQLLREHRLVTMVGAPGAGKTRLALQVARAAGGAFRDGVRTIGLAAVTGPDDLAPAVAAALGVGDDGDAAVEDALVDALGPAELLLLLDNGEHVAGRLAGLIGRVLVAAPRVRVLVTSRVPLAVPGERLSQVPPLSPGEAAELFTDRAALVTDLVLDDDGQDHVRRICERLDGLPLAIELVARRARALSLPDLLHELDGGLAAPRAENARGRPLGTMTATVAWSLRLLTPPQAALFEELSVLVGDFDAAAAQAVAGSIGPSLDDLAALVDHSLVRALPSAAGGLRYRVLEPLRQHGAALLAARGDADVVRRRHAEHFLALARRADRALMREDGHLWYPELARAERNVLAAVGWARELPTDLALQLVTPLVGFWDHRGSVNEGRARVDDLLHRGAPSPRTRAEALLALAHLGYRQGRYAEALGHAREVVDLMRGLDDDDGVARGLRALAMAAAGAEDAPLAVRAGEESVALFRALGDRQAEAWSDTVLGLARFVAGDVDGGAEADADALRVLESCGPVPAVSRRTHMGLTYAADRRHDVAGHRRHLAATIADLRLMGALDGDTEWMWSAATLAQREGRPAATLRVAGAARARGRHGSLLPPVAATVAREALEAAQARVGQREADRLLAAGEELPVEDVVAEALAEPPVPASPLSDRELEIARLTGHGLSNVEIAAALVISRRTVETHQEHVRRKLGLTTRFEVMAWAMAREEAGGGTR